MTFMGKDRSGRRSLAILGSRGIPARYGGFETFAEELSLRLAENGIEVTVYCERGEGELPDTYRGVRLVHIPAPTLGPLTTILFDLRCLWHARKRFDIVYMLGYGTSMFCFIPRLWGSKVWINMDGVEWARSKWGRVARGWFRLMEKVAMWTPSGIVADARGIVEHLKRRHRRIPPVSFIPYGAPLVERAPEPSLLDEWRLEPGGYYLVVSRLVPENCVEQIISGYLESGSAKPLVVVGGTEPATPYIRRLLCRRGERVRFIGGVYEREKLQALRYHAFAYLHGHTVGGTNPSLLEGLGCGNIVIAHDNVFNREITGEAAFYFSDAGSVAACIGRVEALPLAEREWLKLLARERIRTCYNWNRVAGEYLDLVDAAVPPVPETAPSVVLESVYLHPPEHQPHLRPAAGKGVFELNPAVRSAADAAPPRKVAQLP